jgi:hypothetical protein
MNKMALNAASACVLLLCLDAIAAAQSIVPSNAWRGRVRRVEGPFRTVERAHWGSGITPVGGQVLIQGLNVAGSVLTNPDFLSNVLRPRDAEPLGESEAGRLIREIETRNSELDSSISALLGKIGGVPVRSDSSPVTNGQGSGEIQLEALMNKSRELSKLGQAALAELLPALAQVYSMALQIDRDQGGLGLSDEFRSALGQRIAFLNQVAMVLGVGAPGAAEAKATAETVATLDRELGALAQRVAAYRDLLNEQHRVLETVLHSELAGLQALGNQAQVAAAAAKRKADAEALTSALALLAAPPSPPKPAETLPPSKSSS